MGNPIKLLIATPFYEVKGFSPYIRALAHTIIMLKNETSIDVDYMEISGDSYIDRVRNTIANKFMKSDCTHLVFIDSDMSWTLEGFIRLITADVDIVGAGYPCKNNWDFFGCIIHCTPDGRPIVNDKGLIAAKGVPTGFMKIRKEVFFKLAEAYPDDYYMMQLPGEPEPEKHYNFFGRLVVDGQSLGEDISFCHRWQSIMGELWVEPRITISHFGMNEWRGNYHEYLCKCPGGSDDPARAINSGNGGLTTPSNIDEVQA